MSEYFDGSTPTVREEAWGTARRYYYPPPQNVDQYVSRALPQPPTQHRAYSSSTHDLEEAHSRQLTPEHLQGINRLNDGHKRSPLSGGIGEDVMAMVERPEMMIPEDSESVEYPALVSPRPQRPDSRLLSMWANGDELVSPVQTPAEASWVHHIVSPLSEGSERWISSEAGRASIKHESWFNDTSSDEENGSGSSTWARNENQVPHHALYEAFYTQLTRTNLRYSDPGSPLSPGLSWDFGEPGPDIGGTDNASGRQTAQPQIYALSTKSGDRQSHPRDSNASIGEPKVTFAMPNIGTFSSNRPRASQLRVPPPLQLREQSAVHGDYVKTPFPLRSSSLSSQKSISKADESDKNVQKRRSGLGGLSSLRRRSTQNISKPPPGFTEILSQIDYPDTVPPAPRAKNILSKAAHGLGIVRTDSKKEKRQEEPRHQIHLDTE